MSVEYGAVSPHGESEREPMPGKRPWSIFVDGPMALRGWLPGPNGGVVALTAVIAENFTQ